MYKCVGTIVCIMSRQVCKPNHYSTLCGFVTRLIRPVPLVEQEFLTIPEHLISSPVFSGVSVTLSLVLCVCSIDRCLSLCTF
jgi:hypothetical protein